jgi:NAD(P)-dependent dehydrogenase (short-subunit alcohol dehydrogenase family)
VTDAAAVDKLFDAIGGPAKVDILINNAGYLEANRPIHLSDDSWWTCVTNRRIAY